MALAVGHTSEMEYSVQCTEGGFAVLLTPNVL
jgi:hypothetical protein